MTPWDVVESMPASRTVGEAVQRLDQWVHSRVPIQESDDIIEHLLEFVPKEGAVGVKESEAQSK